MSWKRKKSEIVPNIFVYECPYFFCKKMPVYSMNKIEGKISYKYRLDNALLKSYNKEFEITAD